MKVQVDKGFLNRDSTAQEIRPTMDKRHLIELKRSCVVETASQDMRRFTKQEENIASGQKID